MSDSGQERQYLTFMLAEQAYAVNIQRIKEIIEFSQLTEVPLMPPFIRGVINLRGRVVPVVDLLGRFGKGRAETGRMTCIVILEALSEAGQQDIGIMVDAVNEVLGIPVGDIEPPPTFGTQIRTDFIEGIGKVEGRFVVLLAIDHILSVEEQAALQAMDTPEEAALVE